MPGRLGVGVVGLGRWGANLLRALGEVEGAMVTAICDADLMVLTKASGRFRSPDNHLFTSYGDMLDKADMDAVVIATPAKTHVDLTLQALDRSYHVFVEKPAAMKAESLHHIREFMGKQTYMVGHTFLYNDLVTWAKAFIEDGGLGRLLYATGAWMNWGTVRSDVDAFWNFAQHPLSILMYWLGNAPQDVYRMGRAIFQPGIDDVSLVSMRFGSLVSQVALSWLSPQKVRQIMLVGRKATLIFDDVARELQIIQGDSTKTEFTTFGQFMLLKRAGQVLIPRVSYREPLVNEMNHFVDCCLSGDEPRTGIEHAIAVTEAMEGARGL